MDGMRIRLIGDCVGPFALVLSAAVWFSSVAHAGPPERAIAAFVKDRTRVNRAAAVAAIDARWELDTPAGRERFGRALRFVPLWEKPGGSGLTDLTVKLPTGETRAVVVSLPRPYVPRKSYPLIYILHGSGGDGRNIIRWLQQNIGERMYQFVVAAPSHYREVSLVRESQPVGEHVAIWRALRERYHIDPASQHVVGYSKGGYATFVVALSYPDELASATPLACAYAPPTFPGLWEATIGNLRNVSTLHVWGSRDTLAVGEWSIAPTIRDGSRAFREFAAPFGLPLTCIEMPGVGHGTLRPDRARFLAQLRETRPAAPRAVEQTFAHLARGRCYWLEAVAWDDAARDAARRARREAADYGRLREHEKRPAEFVAALGHVAGRRDGNTVEITTRNVGAVHVYFWGEMIDWGQPVRIVWNGAEVFSGKLSRDVDLCLEHFARERDPTRVLWAALRVDGGGVRSLVAEELRAAER